MIEDFSTQFNPFYLSMKYLAIISRHPVYANSKILKIKLIIRFCVYAGFHVRRDGRRYGQKRGGPRKFGERLKTLKNRSIVIFRRDGGKRGRRNYGLCRVYQNRRIRRGKKEF